MWGLHGMQGLGRSSFLCSRRRLAAYVSTWSPLASSFNAKPTKKLNFSFIKDSVGLFGIPELVDPNGFYILQTKVQADVEQLVEEVTEQTRGRKVVEIFDQLSDTLCRVADMADFVRVSHPDSRYAQAAEDTCINLTALVEKLNTNVHIHRALKSVLENGDSMPTDSVDQRVAELFMFDFEQSGIHLEANKRKRFVQLNENIMMLGSFFMQGTHQPARIQKQTLPDHLKHHFALDGDSALVTGLYSDHHSDVVREAAYRIYLQPNQHQLDILDDLLSARHQLANLVEFPTFAHRAIRGTLAQSPENVMTFLNSLSKDIKQSVDIDYKEILAMKTRHGSTSTTIMPWDPPFYAALARQEKCQINTSKLAPYFSLGSCMDGLSHLFRQIYDVTLQPVETEHGEVWSYDVSKLAVVHSTEGVLGYIYCDFFERSGKPNQDCHFTIQGGRQTESGSYQLPVVVLQLNFPSPQSSVPSLLTPGMMENLFHEFGHAMHSMLGRTKYQHVTGTRCPTDFAEVPSVLMEYFVTDPRVLSSFARHYKTGEALPEEPLRNLCNSKHMHAASDLQLQVFYSVVDQVYHGKQPLSGSTSEVLAEIQNEYYGIPHVANTAWQQRFGHLVGYGAKYYSYLMSKAVASKIWNKCFKDDPFSRSMGILYRQEMLVHGGGKPPSDLVEALLGETPTTDMLVQSLMTDLHQSS